VIITVQEEIVNSKTVHADLDALAAENGVKKIEKMLLPFTKGMTVYKTIQAFLMSQAIEGDDGIAHDYIDYVAVGNTGLGFDPKTHEATYLGSVAGAILRAKRMNCLFIPS
jgi:hypothetical protein